MSEARVVPILMMSGANDTLQGTASIEVDGAGPLLGDNARRLLRDLVRQDVSIDVPRSAAPGDAAPSPGSSGTAGLGVSGLPLPGSPDFPPPPINWRRVGYEAECHTQF
jgi:hypothetical protein